MKTRLKREFFNLHIMQTELIFDLLSAKKIDFYNITFISYIFEMFLGILVACENF
jgi:hypothetical protein